MDHFLIKKPWVTEKASNLSVARQYVFLVDVSATKPEIKKAVEALYKVNVVAVNVVNRPSKRKRFRGVLRNAGGGHRKAVVTLEDGGATRPVQVDAATGKGIATLHAGTRSLRIEPSARMVPELRL